MQDAQISFDTREFARQGSVDYWARALSSLYGPVLVTTDDAAGVEGLISGIKLWKLKLCRVEASRHRVLLPTSMARPGTHRLMKVHFQLEGEVDFEQDDWETRLLPGDCLVYNVSRPHVMTSSGFSRHDAAIIPNEIVRRQSVPVEILRARKIAGDDMSRFTHNLLQVFLNDRPMVSEAVAARLADALTSLFQACFSQGVIGTEGFTSSAIMRWRAKRFIEDHLRDVSLDVEQVAAALGCGKRYIHIIFQDEGTTVQRYIWHSRLEQCMQELKSPSGGDKSITDVAFSWGFSSSSHFSRLFKDRFGVTPSAVRAGGENASD
jgi:AraC-like DNA-binding protein